VSRGRGGGASGPRRALLLLGVAVLAGALPLLLAELGLRIAGYQAIYDVYSKPSLFWQHDPLLGWSHTPGSTGSYVGPRPWPVEFETPIRINSLGLRGPELPELPAGGQRLLVLGDSVTVAFEVPFDQTFTALLEESLTQRLGRPVQVVNAGVRGYGTDQSFLYFRDRGHLLAPDAVIFISSNNDPTNNMTLHRMRRPFGKAAFALRGEALALEGSPVPRFPLCSSWVMSATFEPVRTDGAMTRIACQVQLRVADHSALFTFAALRIRQNPDLLRLLYQTGAPTEASNIGIAEAPERLTSRLLVALAEEVERRGSRLAVFLPESQVPELDIASLRGAGARVETLLHSVADGADPEAIRFRNDSHFNQSGHRLLAERIEPVAAALLGEAR